jgi:hypothetical protein
MCLEYSDSDYTIITFPGHPQTGAALPPLALATYRTRVFTNQPYIYARCPLFVLHIRSVLEKLDCFTTQFCNFLSISLRLLQIL